MRKTLVILVVAQVFIILALIIGCGARAKGPEYNSSQPIATEIPEGSLAIAIKEERFGTPEAKPKPHSLDPAPDFQSLEFFDYKIGPHDRVLISVWVYQEAASFDTDVDLNGEITLPFAGKVKLEGLDIIEAKQLLTEKFQSVYKNPVVDVKIGDYRSKFVYFFGEGVVMDPPYVALKKRTTLFDLLPMLNPKDGGLDLDGMYIKRGENIYPLNVRALRNGDLNYNVEILPKDIIYVPSLANKFVACAGEVNQAVLVPFKANMSLFDAIYGCGGFKDDARVSDIRIIRGGLYNPTLITVDLKPFYRNKKPQLNQEEFAQLWMGYDASRQSHKSLEKLLLQPHDLIYVPRTSLGTWNYYYAQIAPTISVIMGIPQTIFSEIYFLKAVK